jgi:deoxyadenosine/deoxycytidine kinase
MQNVRPLIAEIVGPAGAGKSTLSTRLNGPGSRVKAGISVWGLPLATILIGSLISIPTIFSLTLHRKRVRVSDLKQVVRLNALHRHVKRKKEDGEDSDFDALFMDEGVVFALSKLRADNAVQHTKVSDSMLEWERKMIDRWSETLDAIVWLDGPDDLLAERIRTRDKEHRMKDKSEDEITDFLKIYRSSYQDVISELRARGRINIMRFRTDDTSPDRMATEIFRLIKQTHA